MPQDAINWFIMFFSLSIVWYVMRDISRRLGEALHMRRYYLLYDLCEVLLVVITILLFVHFVAGGDHHLGRPAEGREARLPRGRGRHGGRHREVLGLDSA